MRKIKVKLAVTALTASMLFGGCGEALYDLTEQEENIIVNYSAHILAKYNTRQQDGLIYVEQVETEEEAEQIPVETEAEDLSVDETEGLTTDGMQGMEDGEDTSLKTATLQEIFGTEGLEITYVGTRISPGYMENGYYALDADKGKTYLIVGIDLTNIGNGLAEVDILHQMAKFTATVNGETTCSSELTILTEDFSTYEGTIEAGQTVETVLLFQIPDTITEIGDLTMNVSVNGIDYQIILEYTEN